jgi:DeoR/GlpR family transcriptional regulator of sugar metabolism
MVGHVAELAVREFRADQVFMGMRAIDPEHGFTSDYLPEALTDRAILKLASRVNVLADHTKFGRVSTVYLAPVTAARTIISDAKLAPGLAAALRERGLQLLLA